MRDNSTTLDGDEEGKEADEREDETHTRVRIEHIAFTRTVVNLTPRAPSPPVYAHAPRNTPPPQPLTESQGIGWETEDQVLRVKTRAKKSCAETLFADHMVKAGMYF